MARETRPGDGQQHEEGGQQAKPHAAPPEHDSGVVLRIAVAIVLIALLLGGYVLVLYR